MQKPILSFQFEPPNDDWENETPAQRAQRRAQLQAQVDALHTTTTSEGILHQMSLAVSCLISFEDTIVYLTHLDFQGAELLEADRDARAQDLREKRRNLAERIHELKVANRYGWPTLKEYKRKRGTAGNKELEQAIDAVRARSDREKRRDDRKFTPYKYKRAGHHE